MRKRCLLVALTTLLLAAQAPKDDAETKEREALKGLWRVTAFEINGKEIGEEKIKRFEVVFDRKTVTIKANTQERESTYTLDLSKRPRTIDLVSKDNKTTLGIIEREGDRMKLCLALEGAKKRPTEFASKERSDTQMFTLRRQKQ
ncbi:MAG: TIGR03067 domain-containing protein [Gemmataceae bacterium]|nr:TIGR03067 domain-containing protein [Gemmataceae bacterium]